MRRPPPSSGRAGAPAPAGAMGPQRLLDPAWTPDHAPAIARSLGLGALGDRHWKVIASCREETARTGRSPSLRELELLTAFDAAELRRLFPGDFEDHLARIAGLTRPA